MLIINNFDRSDGWDEELKAPKEYKIIESGHSFTKKTKERSKYTPTWLEKS